MWHGILHGRKWFYHGKVQKIYVCTLSDRSNHCQRGIKYFGWIAPVFRIWQKNSASGRSKIQCSKYSQFPKFLKLKWHYDLHFRKLSYSFKIVQIFAFSRYSFFTFFSQKNTIVNACIFEWQNVNETFRPLEVLTSRRTTSIFKWIFRRLF